ncbi:MAG: shikimate kinase [Clostridia bacterium]|nr:shikimate kinase [Clostridia bacterium]
MNLILCGMMGSGKTTVGVKIAELTGRRLCDTDGMIVEKYGPISDIFERFGEDYFRKLETQAVKTLVQTDGLVVSTGGGLVLNKENVATLKENGKIVFLRAKLDTLAERLSADTTRPLLQTAESLRHRLQTLLSARMPIYESVADCIVDVDKKSVAEIAIEIVSWMEDKTDGAGTR